MVPDRLALVCKECGVAGSVNIVPNWHDKVRSCCAIHQALETMSPWLVKLTADRPYADPEKAARRILEIANAVGPIHSRSIAPGSRCTSQEPSSPSRRPALSCSPDEQRKPQKFFATPLKPNPVFLIFLSPPYGGVRVPDGPGPETGTGRVRCRS